MSVKHDGTGHRSVQLEFEVPGTPEQVWRAIATGPGISSWFVPTEVVEREGGAIDFDLGAGMTSSGLVTAWEPPVRFAYEERDWLPNAPPIATELTVEARSGGTCVVRLVHSLFATSEDWDDQLESMESGWPSFFHVLRLYLSHFCGQRCSHIHETVTATGGARAAWIALTTPLGLGSATAGQRWTMGDSSLPQMAGTIEQVNDGGDKQEFVVRLAEPAPGVAVVGAYTWDNKAFASIHFYMFGDEAPAVVVRDGPLWRTWMHERFPSVGAESSVV